MRRSSRPLVVALLALFAFAPRAQAHSTIQGLDDFANGILHPLFTLQHLLVLLALALALAQHRPLRLRLPLLAFASASAAALALTTTGLVAHFPPVVLPGIALVIGILVASAIRLPPLVQVILFALAALALGLDSPVDAPTSTAAIAKTLSATWLSLSISLVNIAFYLSLLPEKKWLQIALRVAASWIVAISFLVLAFAIRPR